MRCFPHVRQRARPCLGGLFIGGDGVQLPRTGDARNRCFSRLLGWRKNIGHGRASCSQWNADGQGQRQRPGQGQGQRQRHKQGSGQVEWSAPEWWPQQDAHTSPSAIDSCGRPSAASAPQADPSTNSSSSVAASAAASTQWNTDSQGQRQRPGQGQGQRQRHKQGSGQGRWPAPGWWPEQDAHTSPSAIDSTNSSPSIVGAAAAAPSSSSSSCPAPTGSACVLDQQLVAADTDPHLVGRRSVAACSCTSTRDLLVADQRS